MPLLLDKNFSREEKEKYVKDLVLQVAHIAWYDGYAQCGIKWQSGKCSDWYDLRKAITEPDKIKEVNEG